MNLFISFSPIISLFLGFISWAIPGYALLANRSRPYAAASSFGFCAAALYGQFFLFEDMIRLHDWSALEDTIHGEVVAATALITVTLALNLLAWILPKAGRKNV